MRQLRMKGMHRGKEKELLTAEEGVPGVRFQHVSAMATGRTGHPWYTAVAGQALWDVSHTVHLQAGLVWREDTAQNIA